MKFQTAPAKINLALHIVGQRDDGYHLIDSLVVFADTVSAADTLIASDAPTDGFDISGIYGDALPSSDKNLVIQARSIVRHSAAAQSIATRPVHISLEKRLPLAAGLGGGSADAAAAIKLLHAHWGVGYDSNYAGPAVLAEKLGADVPMCLLGAPLRASGIGEKIRRVDIFPAMHMVLVNCGEMVSTPEVFGRLEEKQNLPIIDMPESDYVGWLKDRTRNDLLAPAMEICPSIKQSLDALYANGAAYAQMSGSGATCFGIFGSARAASDAAKAIGNAQPDWWVVATKTGASAVQSEAV